MDPDTHFSPLPKLVFCILISSVLLLSVTVISLLTVLLTLEEGIHVENCLMGLV